MYVLLIRADDMGEVSINSDHVIMVSPQRQSTTHVNMLFVDGTQVTVLGTVAMVTQRLQGIANCLDAFVIGVMRVKRSQNG